MGNRRKPQKQKQKEEKLKCPDCGGTEFDVLENYGIIEDITYDALACRNCKWSGAVPAHKIRSVKE